MTAGAHNSKTSIRPAGPEDAETIHHLIRALAEYEREPDAVKLTISMLREQLASEHPPFECVIADRNGEVAGFALYFQTYSTWRGRCGLWLEDFFVLPSHRRHGVGRALFAALGEICRQRGYARFEFSVLNWNELAHGFYRSVSAEPLRDWTTWRVTLTS